MPSQFLNDDDKKGETIIALYHRLFDMVPWLFGFRASKARTQCQLGVARIKLLRNKKTIQVRESVNRFFLFFLFFSLTHQASRRLFF